MSDPCASLNQALAALSARLAAVEGKLGVAAPAASVATPPSAPAASSGGDDAAFVKKYDEMIDANIVPFVATCNKIGGKVAKLGAVVEKAFGETRTFLVMASKCKKPKGAPQSYGPFLKPISQCVRDAGALRERDDYEFHARAVIEGMSAFSWVAIEPAPAPFVESAVDASVFWANKVRLNWKKKEGGDDHVKFCAQLNAVWKGLYTYVKANHKTGLTWNFQGGDVENFSAPAAPAKKAEAPKAAAPVKKAGGLGSVFAELSKIDQSSGKTAGLRHVTKDMKSKNQPKKSSVVKAAPAKAAPAKKWGAKASAASKPAKLALQGNKWVVDYQKGMCEIAADQIRVNHTVYIYGAVGATIIVKGKCNGIIVDGCKKTKVLFESVIAACEIVNCKSVQVQAKGQCSTISIDKTDGIVVYLSREFRDSTKIVTSKSSEMNVSFPGASDEDDYIEVPIPEQFVHNITSDGKVSSDVSELYSSG